MEETRDDELCEVSSSPDNVFVDDVEEFPQRMSNASSGRGSMSSEQQGSDKMNA